MLRKMAKRMRFCLTFAVLPDDNNYPVFGIARLYAKYCFWEFLLTTGCLNYRSHGWLYNFACAHGLADPNLLNTRGRY